MRERNGHSVPAVFTSESAALGWIKARIAPGTIVNADEAPGWDALHAHFEMRRTDHSQVYNEAGACTNMAEKYFSRLRRAEAGHHHYIAGAYLLRYVQEASRREDNRRMSNGEQTRRVAGLALGKPPRRTSLGIGSVTGLREQGDYGMFKTSSVKLSINLF